MQDECCPYARWRQILDSRKELVNESCSQSVAQDSPANIFLALKRLSESEIGPYQGNQHSLKFGKHWIP
jgi:hypothetical protein